MINDDDDDVYMRGINGNASWTNETYIYYYYYYT